MSCTPTICLPDFCGLLGQTGNSTCEEALELFPTFNGLFGATYAAYKAVPLLKQGIPEQLQSNLTWWFVRLITLQAITWWIMFLIVFIILMIRGIISYDLGILLILLMTGLVVLFIGLITLDTSDVVVNVSNTTRKMLADNWEIYGDQIRCNFTTALFTPNTIKCPQVTDNELFEKYRQLGENNLALINESL